MASIANHPHSRPATGMLVALLLPACAGAAAQTQPAASNTGAGQGAQWLAAGDLADLSLEELANVRVTSVTGRPRSAHNAAASVFVITREDIRRSAVTSLPEALRLAPTLQVARVNATQYAISARGFNNNIGNKLLVLIDGRTVYSPLFSGVFWDAQNVMLEDIDRIEVISGPGATLWGANAVNGVINVITRSAQETTGALLAAQGATEGSNVAARFGGSAGVGAFRIYGMRGQRNNTGKLAGNPVSDATANEQVGFRFDSKAGASQGTVQGDVYRGGGGVTGSASPQLSGGNLLTRWKQMYADGSNWQLQMYFDQASRVDNVVYHDKTRTLDVEFNHVPALSGPHTLIWGLGWRLARDETVPTPLVLFDPQTRNLRWASVFVQDEVQATEKLQLTAGAKVETNVYTGAEFLPTLRASYELGDASVLWTSLSRAARAPARLDRDFYFPAKPPFIIAGGPDFQSEIANVAELGYRGQHVPGIGYSITAFRSDYTGLRAGRAAPTDVENLASGSVQGVEAWGSIDISKSWRLSGGLVAMHKSLQAAPQAGANSVANLGDDPKQQWMLRSTASLTPNIDLDVAVRHVSALPDPAVPSSTVADLRLGWRLSSQWQASLLAQNLGRGPHIEYDPASASAIGPLVFLRLEWRLP